MRDCAFAKALVMSIKLNDAPLIGRVIESVPPARISLCVEALAPRYLETLMVALSERVGDTRLLHFYLRWLNALCTRHGPHLKSHFARYLPYFT